MGITNQMINEIEGQLYTPRINYEEDGNNKDIEKYIGRNSPGSSAFVFKEHINKQIGSCSTNPTLSKLDGQLYRLQKEKKLVKSKEMNSLPAAPQTSPSPADGQHILVT
ncbi:hypothetical protein CHS0354_012005, partial [Potamilus streckersoni]